MDNPKQPPESAEITIRRKVLLPVILIELFLILLIVVFNYLHWKPADPKKEEVAQYILGVETQQKTQWFPMRLKIPSINVDTAIEYVGLTTEGAMEVPNNTANAGWFTFGPRPGEIGSAVIAGHSYGENGSTAVFSNLYKLKEGDKLYVKDTSGKTITFTVRALRTYNPGYAEEVFKLNDIAHLNLITCDGEWNGVEESYSKRLVVFADIMF